MTRHTETETEEAYTVWTYELRGMLAYLSAEHRYERLTKWEQKFVDEIGDFRMLSRDQHDKLLQIHDEAQLKEELIIEAESTEFHARWNEEEEDGIPDPHADQ